MSTSIENKDAAKINRLLGDAFYSNVSCSFEDYPAAASSEPEKYVFPAIYNMNSMYRLPVRGIPCLSRFTGFNGQIETATDRLDRFMKTLSDELQEYVKPGSDGSPPIRDLVERFVAKEKHAIATGQLLSYEDGCPCDEEQEALTALADWFADLMVYIMSESMKFGINVFDILVFVMGSNFTKLGADGKPIYDENGKFQKGPNYLKPEVAIRDYLVGRIYSYVNMKQTYSISLLKGHQ